MATPYKGYKGYPAIREQVAKMRESFWGSLHRCQFDPDDPVLKEFRDRFHEAEAEVIDAIICMTASLEVRAEEEEEAERKRLEERAA